MIIHKGKTYEDPLDLINRLEEETAKLNLQNDEYRIALELIMTQAEQHHGWWASGVAQKALTPVIEKRNHETVWCTCVPEKDGTHQPDCVGEPILMKINVNGTRHDWPDSKPLYYEDILKLAGEREGASVMCKPADKRLAGFTLCRGQSCPPTEGMTINCIMTGNA